MMRTQGWARVWNILPRQLRVGDSVPPDGAACEAYLPRLIHPPVLSHRKFDLHPLRPIVYASRTMVPLGQVRNLPVVWDQSHVTAVILVGLSAGKKRAFGPMEV